jgi:ribosomal protein S18 acetylase RimI-like enzyme
MIALPKGFRRAVPDDAPAMAELVNMAGEGMPHYLWSLAASAGQSGWDVGRQRAQRESGAYSYRNTVVRTVDDRVAAMLTGYPLGDEPDPDGWKDLPPMFVHLQELEDLVPGTWYVNILASYPAFRGKGYGTELLGIAEQFAAITLRQGLSIIVSDGNTGARRLYERNGYKRIATRPVVKDGWETDSENWDLLVKRF